MVLKEFFSQEHRTAYPQVWLVQVALAKCSSQAAQWRGDSAPGGTETCWALVFAAWKLAVPKEFGMLLIFRLGAYTQ